MNKYVCLLTTCLAASSVQANELPEPSMMVLTSGIICDTYDEVTSLLTAISLNNNQFPADPPEGCGKVIRPIAMMATPVEWYFVPQGRLLITRFDTMQGWTQFGWSAFIPNPDYVPAALSSDA